MKFINGKRSNNYCKAKRELKIFHFVPYFNHGALQDIIPLSLFIIGSFAVVTNDKRSTHSFNPAE